MKPLDLERLEELFYELLTLDRPARKQRLVELRENSTEAAQRLERMLLVDQETNSATQHLPAETAPLGEPEIGEAIGPFRLISVLGEGGMGVVYVAEQTEPMQRRVAVKLIKRGMDSKAILLRFEAERRALALMEHPNIARVYEAGASDDGRPYFAMEWVNGLPIDRYCLEHRLSMEERLRLVMDACSAVQHAHKKGIIHRDLKPSNVLVAENEGVPVVKVIDFGIAKAVSEADNLETRFTRHGQLVGTLEYMSPEQAQGEDIDTRSDVYSLGVILFELLVGEPPLSRQQIRKGGLEEMRRRIREFETPRPSDRVVPTTAEGRRLAQERNTNPVSLSRALRKDLDWVVVKALDKQPDGRYQSPAELAADLGRYLANQPVLAGPPTFEYRARKFMRRNRSAVLGAVALTLALSLGVAGLSLGLVEARRSEAVALRESKVSKEVLEFMGSMLSDGAGQADQGRILTTPELFDRVQERLQNDPPEDPRVYGTILNRIAEFYLRDLEDSVAAEPLLEKAAVLLRSTDGAEEELSRSQYMLGFIHRMRGDLKEARRFHDEALALKHLAAEKSDFDTLGVAEVLGEQALILRAERREEEALILVRRAADLVEKERGTEFVETLSKKILLAQILSAMGRFDEADEELEHVLEISERLEYWNHVAVATNDLGANGFRRGHLGVAYERFQRALEVNREYLGEDPMRLGVRMSNLGMVAAKRGDYGRAEELVRGALDLLIPVQSEQSVSAIISRQILGEVLLRAGRLDEAARVLETVLPLAYAAPGLDAPIGPFRAERNLAQIEAWTHRAAAARRRLDRAIAHQEWSKLDPVGRCELRISRAALTLGIASVAALATAKDECGDAYNHPSVRYQLARYYAAKGEAEQAVGLLQGLPLERFVDAWHGLDPAFSSLVEEPGFQAFLQSTAPG